MTGAPVPLCKGLQAGAYGLMVLTGAGKLAMSSLNGGLPNGRHHGSERKPCRRLSGYQVGVQLSGFRSCLPPVATMAVGGIFSWVLARLKRRWEAIKS